MFYVYVLRSDADLGFYIGYSSDLKKRFAQHQKGDAAATSYRGPWKLIYYEAYTEREDAEGREKFLKSGAGRRFLRTQLRHYLRAKRLRLTGLQSECPVFPLISHVSQRFYVARALRKASGPIETSEFLTADYPARLGRNRKERPRITRMALVFSGNSRNSCHRSTRIKHRCDD